jgi:hypothetical protein
MGKTTNAHIVLNSRDRTGGQYNSALFNAVNQNIMQGDIQSITVSEVNFPYDIPNIQAGYNVFELVAGIDTVSSGNLSATPISTPGLLYITITPGFYTGTELQTAINTAISAQQVLVGDVATNAPTFSYNATTNQYTMLAPATASPTNPTPVWTIFSAYTFPLNYGGTPSALGKDILSIMGYYNEQAGPGTLTLNRVSSAPADTAFRTFASGSAPLVFTQYIDICSPQLCKFQYLRDGSTTNLARRSDILCRLYICNDISLVQAEVDGTRPFIINRQFYNARVMKWTVDNSVGTIDINLYDDVGQPLQTSWIPRPYQITFNAVENYRDEGLGF